MPVQVHNWVSWRSPWSARPLVQLLEAMLTAVGAEDMPLEAHFVRDGAMALENARHMGCCGPTNVLSFPPESGAWMNEHPAPAMPGILLLSVDTLDRECLLYGQSRQEHALRLLAHGMAHILGYDHGAEMDEISSVLEAAGMDFLQTHETCGGHRQC